MKPTTDLTDNLRCCLRSHHGGEHLFTPSAAPSRESLGECTARPVAKCPPVRIERAA